MSKKIIGVVALALVAIGIASCGAGGDSSSDARPEPPLVGVGSTLTAPLMSRWQTGYERRTGEKVRFTIVPYGVEIRRPGAGADFGAADAPITPFQFTEGNGGIQMLPWALTAIAVVYNLPGAPNHLKLDSAALVGILLGEITAWNDPAIAALNPGVKLPARRIVPVFHREENGEDYALTNYLSPQSRRFEYGGITRRLRIPGGIGVNGAAGIASRVARTPGAFGYVDLGTARAHALDIALIQNAAGRFPAPTLKTIEAAAAARSRIGPNRETSIAELPPTAKNAYPIAFYIYAIVQSEPQRAKALKRFLSYAVSPAGQALGASLYFAPLPENVLRSVQFGIRQLQR